MFIHSDISLFYYQNLRSTRLGPCLTDNLYHITKQEGQVALKRSPEFCLSLYTGINRLMGHSLANPTTGSYLR